MTERQQPGAEPAKEQDRTTAPRAADLAPETTEHQLAAERMDQAEADGATRRTAADDEAGRPGGGIEVVEPETQDEAHATAVEPDRAQRVDGVEERRMPGTHTAPVSEEQISAARADVPGGEGEER
jgi:hypothetical protein